MADYLLGGQFRGGQSRRKLFANNGTTRGAYDFMNSYFRKGRNKRVQRESEKERKYFEIRGRNDMTQHAASQQRGKLIDITKDHRGFDDAEKDIQELEQLLRCKVCLDSDACIVFLPCRHMATCEYCEGFLHHCPVCRSFIEEAVKINEE